MKKKKVCNEDCFNCPYIDCIAGLVVQKEKRPYHKTGLDTSDKKAYMKAYNKKYYAAHAKERNAYYNEWKKTHEEEIKAKNRAYYLKRKGEKCSAQTADLT